MDFSGQVRLGKVVSSGLQGFFKELEWRICFMVYKKGLE